MKNQTPFLDVQSFVMEEVSRDTLATSVPVSSPFLSLYESEEGNGMIDPEAEAYVTFLNELYDEEFDEALSGLVNEATTILEIHYLHEKEDEDPQTVGYQAERLLNQHFAPLVAEAEAMFGALARKFSQRDPNTLTDEEIETIVDRYRSSVALSPSSEEFLGKLKKAVNKAVKKVGKKAVALAKKGAVAVATGGISLILPKLMPLIKPLLKRVSQTAIGMLPPPLQPIARKLAERLPFLKELEEGDESVSEAAATYEVAEIQYEFNQHVANLLFAPTEVEQDLEVAKALTEQQAPDTYPLAGLDRARDRFVQNLQRLKEGEDPTPHIDNFVPAILPALRMGINLIGRERVVAFLAKHLGKLIKKIVGPQHAPKLSKAIVDAGLRLIQLEATPEDESQAAASAVAATVEETVRRVAALPDYIIDDHELLEAWPESG